MMSGDSYESLVDTASSYGISPEAVALNDIANFLSRIADALEDLSSKKSAS